MMEILLSSSLLVLVLALFRRLLRGRIDPRLQYALWLLVALRLLIPGTLFTLPVSLSDATVQLGQSIAETILTDTPSVPSSEQEDNTSDALPQESSPSSAVPESSVSVSAPSESPSPTYSEDTAASPQPEKSDGSAADEPVDVPIAQRFLSLLDPLYDAYTKTAEYPLGTSQEQVNHDILDQGYFINGYQVDLEGGHQIVTYSRYASIWDMPFWRWPWYAGMAVMGCLLVGTNLHFALTLRKKRRRLSPDVLPGDCSTPVYLVEDLASPCLCGLLRPVIYVNERSLAPGRLPHILAHEQAHLRHGDHLWALLRMVCLCVYWFDPFVWWAAVLSRRDGELACDHSAIRRLGEDQRLEYGQTLVDMIVPGRALSGLLRTATTMTDKKRTMKERILLIAKRPQMAIATLVLVLLGTALAAVLAFSGGQKTTNASDSSSISRLSFSQPGGDSFLNRREGVYTFLIAGLEDTEIRTDTLLLATYDVKAGEVNFLSIPRDTAVDVPWSLKKINTVYGYRSSSGGGIENLKQQVRDLTGVFPDYYFVVDTDTVGQLVDALGGVWFDVPQDMDYNDPYQNLQIHQEAGYRLLTGEDAMEIVRFRRYSDGDLVRIQVQQNLMKAVIQQCLELEDWSDVLELAGVFSENVTTDMPASSLLWFAQQAMEIDSDQIRFFTLPTDESSANLTLRTGNGFSTIRQYYLLADPEETAELINQYFNPYTYDISSAELCRMVVTEDGELIRDSGSYIHVSHSAGLFSFDLQTAEESAASITWTEEAMGLTLYREGDASWFLQIIPQPEDWLENHPSDSQILLTGFDTNGTPHRYVLEWQGDFIAEAQRQAVADSFTLTLDAARISQLVHENYRKDYALAVSFLPYLSWSDYLDTYGGEEASDLLNILYNYAGTFLTWNQYHDIFSFAQQPLDGTYAEAYQDILLAMYRQNGEQFASVLGSVYITDGQRDAIVALMRQPLADELGRSEALSDGEVQEILGLGSGSSSTEASVAGDSTEDWESINSIMRAYAPSVMEAGSPENLAIDLTGDWTLAGIQSAIFTALEDYTEGTLVEGDLVSVAISYAFQFPADLRDGTVLTVPYTASYQGDSHTLPSGEKYAPSVTTSQLTATVRLVGEGTTAPVDNAFPDGQAAYQKLERCTQGISLEAVSGGSFDLLPAIQDAIESNLEAAGLAESYQITALSLGSYTIPTSLTPGTVQTVSGTVSFASTSENGIAIPAISFTVTCTTVEG